MTFNNEIEEVKAQIKVLEKKLSFLEEIEKQPRMNLQQEGEYAVVSYHDKVYYRLESEFTFSWYIKKGVSANHPVPTLVMVVDAETERLLEGIYYNHIQVKKEKEQRTKSPVKEAYKDWWGQYPETGTWDSFDDTRWLGFQAGYHLAYEEMVVEEPKEQKWDVVRESVKWCKEHPEESVEDYLKPKTPEETAQSLKEAFVKAQQTEEWKETQRKIDAPKESWMDEMVAELKGQNLTDILYRWWCDVFTTNEEWDAENVIEDLVDRIELFLPKEQSAKGSQNAYVECTVEGFNDCLKKIKGKLR